MKHFRITVEPLGLIEAGSESIWFEVQDQDDLIALANGVPDRFEINSDDGRAFAIGLKIFAGVVVKNRQREPFSRLRPPLTEVMKIIKQP